MAAPKRKKPKPPSKRDRGYSKILHHLVRGMVAANKKLDMLAENAGLNEKLRQLNEQLGSATDSLEAAVKRNQPS